MSDSKTQKDKVIRHLAERLVLFIWWGRDRQFSPFIL